MLHEKKTNEYLGGINYIIFIILYICNSFDRLLDINLYYIYTLQQLKYL